MEQLSWKLCHPSLSMSATMLSVLCSFIAIAELSLIFAILHLGDGDVAIHQHRKLAKRGLFLWCRPSVGGVLVPLEIQLACK